MDLIDLISIIGCVFQIMALYNLIKINRYI